MRLNRFLCLLVALFAFSSTAVLADDPLFAQHQNVVYAEVHGVGLVMDIFVPKGEKNGLAVVDVVSGAWHSDRGKIRDHMLTQTFHTLCRKGYVVFGVRPGSITKFSALEMRDHVNQGIRWVKDHAKEYGVDPERLGMMGASAGGHLACLTAMTASDGSEVDGKKPPFGDTRVKAVAVFFPPTDFLMFGDKPAGLHSEDRISKLTRRLVGIESTVEPGAEDVTKMLTQISPARLVTPKAPPLLLIHGDADPVVPLQQSEVMVEAYKKAGVPVELVIKKGGAHPWLTIHEEVKVLSDWFDKQLAGK
jgi:acetyl esterase/lipase